MKKVKSLSAGLLLTTLVTATPFVGIVASGAAHAGYPPSCLNTSSWSGRWTTTAKIVNRCKNTYRVKVQWSPRMDGRCTTLKPGYQTKSQVPRGARFSGVKYC